MFLFHSINKSTTHQITKFFRDPCSSSFSIQSTNQQLTKSPNSSGIRVPLPFNQQINNSPNHQILPGSVFLFLFHSINKSTTHQITKFFRDPCSSSFSIQSTNQQLTKSPNSSGIRVPLPLPFNQQINNSPNHQILPGSVFLFLFHSINKSTTHQITKFFRDPCSSSSSIQSTNQQLTKSPNSSSDRLVWQCYRVSPDHIFLYFDPSEFLMFTSYQLHSDEDTGACGPKAADGDLSTEDPIS